MTDESDKQKVAEQMERAYQHAQVLGSLIETGARAAMSLSAVEKHLMALALAFKMQTRELGGLVQAARGAEQTCGAHGLSRTARQLREALEPFQGAAKGSDE